MCFFVDLQLNGKYTPEIDFGPNQQGVTAQCWEDHWSPRKLLPGCFLKTHEYWGGRGEVGLTILGSLSPRY